MKLTDIIHPEAIIPHLQASDRDGVIRELVAVMAAAGVLEAGDVEEVAQAAIARESRGSTGFGKGVAVPHVKHAAVRRLGGAIGRSPDGVDFTALDQQPVYSVVLLLTPEDQPHQHLQAMEVIFRNLQEDMFRRFLRQADSSDKVLDLLSEADAR